MSAAASARPLRADAARNLEQIRRAALDVFRRDGLTAPLDRVARAAGVTKGTIYHRFGTREALVDAVVDELARAAIERLIAESAEQPDAGARFEHYLLGTWLLQYDEPAVNDVMTEGVQDSLASSELCARASAQLQRLLREAQADGLARPELSAADLRRFIWERGVALREGERMPRDDYERHCRYLLAGLR